MTTPELPLNQWSTVTITVDNNNRLVTIAVSGALVAAIQSAVFPTPAHATNPAVQVYASDDFGSAAAVGIRNLRISSTTAIPVQYFPSTSNPNGVTVTRGNLVGVVALPAVYFVSFDIFPTASGTDWRNILHLTASGRSFDSGGLYGRLPGVWFCQEASCPPTALLLSYAASSGSDVTMTTPELPLNQWSTVTITVDNNNRLVTIAVSGALVAAIQYAAFPTPAHATNPAVQVYASDDFDLAADASVRSLAIRPAASFTTTGFLPSSPVLLGTCLDARLVVLQGGSLGGLDVADDSSSRPVTGIWKSTSFSSTAASVTWFMYFFDGNQYLKGITVAITTSGGSAYAAATEAWFKSATTAPPLSSTEEMYASRTQQNLVFSYSGEGYGAVALSGIINSADAETGPTGQPTAQPSRQPTLQPSGEPTGQPSRLPTGQPTRQPTSQPSGQPSRLPTSQPSSLPTGQPTLHPTSQPSGQPSRLPTSQPSSLPTGQPTLQPTSLPTLQPTCRPTAQPSRQPTSQPTNPTGQPTSAPSPVPTPMPSPVPTLSAPANLYRTYHSGSGCDSTPRVYDTVVLNQCSEPTQEQPFYHINSCKVLANSYSVRQRRFTTDVHSLRRKCRGGIVTTSKVVEHHKLCRRLGRADQHRGYVRTHCGSMEVSALFSREQVLLDAYANNECRGTPTRRGVVLNGCHAVHVEGSPLVQHYSLLTYDKTASEATASTTIYLVDSQYPTDDCSGQPLLVRHLSYKKGVYTKATQRRVCDRDPLYGGFFSSATHVYSLSSFPTARPTPWPSQRPVFMPTGQPSSQPTSPTGQPTRQPSRLPTGQPTRCPTGQPTGQPTRCPTGQPTGQPTRQPSSQPTGAPSGPTPVPSSAAPTSPGDASVAAWSTRLAAAGTGASPAVLAAHKTFYDALAAAGLTSKITRLNTFSGNDAAAALIPLLAGGGTNTETMYGGGAFGGSVSATGGLTSKGIFVTGQLISRTNQLVSTSTPSDGSNVHLSMYFLDNPVSCRQMGVFRHSAYTRHYLLMDGTGSWGWGTPTGGASQAAGLNVATGTAAGASIYTCSKGGTTCSTSSFTGVDRSQPSDWPVGVFGNLGSDTGANTEALTTCCGSCDGTRAAGYSIGHALTDSDVAALNTAWKQLNSDLGRS